MDDIRDIIEEIKSRCDIADVISDYIQLKQSGSNYKGLCPFHGEKTPSFHVNSSKQIFKCFGCGEGGDIISFIMKIENLDFIDSVKFLANKCGVEFNQHFDEETKLRLNRIKLLQEINIEAARFFYCQLMENEGNPAISYLRKRGLDDTTIRKFGLGFAPDSWNAVKDYLLSKNYSIEDILECGLVVHNVEKNIYYDKYRNRVIFPIFDYKTNIIGFGGRVLDDSLPKYLNSPESILFNKRLNLYGLNFARKEMGNSKQIILVEGYMDLISLYQYGIKNVVATLGTALTDSQAELISRFAEEVIIAYDSDEAGVNATLRALQIIDKTSMKARILSLEDSKDPDEFVRSKGLSYTINTIDNSIDATTFRINLVASKYNLSDRKEGMSFLKEAVKIIRNLKSPLELDYYVNYLSGLTNTNNEIILNEAFGDRAKSVVKNIKGSRKNNTNIQPLPKLTTNKIEIADDINVNTERNIIKAMMISEKAREFVPLKIDIDEFYSDSSKKLYKIVLESNKKGIINIEDIFNNIDDVDYVKKLDEVDLSLINFDDIVEIEKLVNNFKKHKISDKIEELSKKLKILEDRLKTMEDKTKESEEVQIEIMKITLEIVENNKIIKSL